MRQKAIVSMERRQGQPPPRLRTAQKYDIVALLTTVTSGYDRISMHGVPRPALLEQQAAVLNYPLDQVLIPPRCSQ